ncbi:MULTISPECIES: DUF4347 domain-containing protein, partial [Spirulina sp. CCY15215]|uniref:DUF4347 domain-containing protein n=1 Tax=Spirulina sp. CCY15215 TaxID=2767591 RepID=UPI0019510A65
VATENGNITLAAIPGKSQVRLSHEGMVVNLVLDAAPVEGNVIISANARGIRAVDIPRYITGGSEIGHANEVIIEADGTVRLVRSDSPVNEGDTVIAGEVNAENITLMAAGRVTPIENDLISNSPTVVLFPEAIGDTVETSFIDEGVEDYQSLLYGGQSGTISQVVTHQENGIDVITETLTEIAAQGGKVSAVHLLNEGNEGEFWLGNAYVSNETIAQYQAQLQQWGIALTEEADILLYSCFTALGETGTRLINDLAGLTGADVAASTNLTGNAALGGDWNLEVQTGSIEAGLGLEQQVMDNFAGKLVVFTATDAASLIAAINSANGNAVTDTINFAGNITLTAVENSIDGSNGLPSITAAQKLTINGMGNTLARDAAAPGFRLLHVALGADLEVNETTLSGGLANSGGFGSYGGAIFNRGTLAVNNSTVSGNSAGGNGGGLFAFNDITLTNSTVSGNSAGFNGGGLFANNDITLTN